MLCGSGPIDPLGCVTRADSSCLAIFLVISGRREQARRGARRGVSRPRPSCTRSHFRSAPKPGQPGASPCVGGSETSQPDDPACLVGLHGRSSCSWRRWSLKLAPFPAGGVVAPSRQLLQGLVRRHPHPRADRPGGRLGRLASGKGPVVGAFHAYATRRSPTTWQLRRRPARLQPASPGPSEAAAWTGQRWYGGRYKIVPKGSTSKLPPAAQSPSDELRVLFVGRARNARACRACSGRSARSRHVRRLDAIGGDRWKFSASWPTQTRTTSIFAARYRATSCGGGFHHADVLCAPSLAGESFGMVLTEAFAAGTPVIASGIAGYSDVVTDGLPAPGTPGDPQRLAEEFQRAYLEPERLSAWPTPRAELQATPGTGRRSGSTACDERDPSPPAP